MGVTGLKRAEIKKHIWKLRPKRNRVRVRYSKVYAYKEQTQFNPCSINLYDEDIVTIMQSHGLIGVSMDERILGGTNSKFGEFVYPKEFEDAFIQDSPKSFIKNHPNCMDNEEDNVDLETEDIMPVDEDDVVTDFPAGGDIYHLANNIIHILKVGFEHQIDEPWKYITIGSDYDGLINPIDKDDTKLQSITIDQVSDMLMDLPDILIAVASTAGIKNHVENHIHSIIECYAHKNLEDFVKKFYLA